MTESNPFAGRTLRIPRPAASHVDDEQTTRADLAAAQAQWDHAESARIEALTGPTNRYAELMAAETFEEPASKALENRLRVAFLAIRGNTMAMWQAQRDAIVARATGDSRRSSAS